jgi:glycosyl transferase family 25
MQASHPLSPWVDHIYVIAVKTAKARIASIQAELDRVGLPFTFMFDHDAAELTDEQIKAVFAPSDMRRPHQSLVLKNMAIWRDALAQGFNRVMIFEDDALLLPGFMARAIEGLKVLADKPPGHLLFLGGLDSRLPLEFFLEAGPLVEQPITTAEACVHDRLAMQRRLDWLARHKVTVPVDHLMRLIDKETGTTHWWLRHPVVDQGSITGRFRSDLDSKRKQRAALVLRIRHRVNVWRFWRWRTWRARILHAMGMLERRA